MLNNIKTIASWGLGIPAAIIVASEAQTSEGIVLQVIAVGVIVAVLLANGLLRKGVSYGK